MPMDHNYSTSRRRFLTHTSAGLGTAAVAGLLNPQIFADSTAGDAGRFGSLDKPHFPPKAKRVIYLFMAGGPSHIDTFDPKPLLTERNGQELPQSVRGKQRITTMTRNQKQLLVAASPMKFSTSPP